MVTGLTFGCARLRPDKRSEDILRECYDLGIRSYDTASSYGTEFFLGRYFEGQSDIEISTKVGLRSSEPVGPDNSFYYKFAKPVLAQIPFMKRCLFKMNSKMCSRVLAEDQFLIKKKVELNCQQIQRSIDQSLLYLKRDSLDILLLHEPLGFFVDDQVIRILDDYRSQGLIRQLGEGYGEIFDGSLQLPQSDWLYCKYGSKIPTAKNIKVKFHGLLRELGLGGLTLVKKHLFDARVIFSASSRSQVREVVKYWNCLDS